MQKKNLLVLIVVSLLIIVCISWFLNSKKILSEKGAELNQEVIKKDIALLTKDTLKISKVEIFDNRLIPEATVKKME
jgi:competence protein ComGC